MWTFLKNITGLRNVPSMVDVYRDVTSILVCFECHIVLWLGHENINFIELNAKNYYVMVEKGFVMADSRNIPQIDMFMVAEFIKNDTRYNAAEIRLVKASLSSRESYGDTAIGYVCLQRTSTVCTIKGKICPEHRVRNKKYSVVLTVDTKNDKIEDVRCEDCPAALGGCKHALAFLMWLHRRSEHRSPTEIECYWKKPLLGTVGTTKKFIEVKELCKKEISNVQTVHDSSTFFNNVMMKAREKQLDSQVSRHKFELDQRLSYSLSLHQLIIRFLDDKKSSADEFIRYAFSQTTPDMCSKIEIETRDQKDNLLWHELRYGRVTASVLYEVAHCKTSDGSLVMKILGASKKFDSEEMERGRALEKSVIQEIETQIKKKLVKCGFMLIQQFPILGASPDAKGDDFVVEIKCPSKDSTFENYISNGNITAKCMAQIQLQMVAAGTQKGLFCVADPKFEENKKITSMWVQLDNEHIHALIKNAVNFWKANIFTKMKTSICK